jgi:hypothetical protein
VGGGGCGKVTDDGNGGLDPFHGAQKAHELVGLLHDMYQETWPDMVK